MERVAFLIEETGERISCLLNPESLTVRRTAGVRSQPPASGRGLSDDPLLFTGGGRTEIALDLLFDVNVAGSSITSKDVRDLTRPFWQLAENTQKENYAAPPLARFVWGKAWNVLGVVVAVAERFEQFTAAGEPQRSWLRMRFVRVAEPARTTAAELSAEHISTEQLEPPNGVDSLLDMLPGNSADEPMFDLTQLAEETDVHQLIGGETLSELAFESLDDPAQWRWLAWWNGIIHPLKIAAGTLIRVPPATFLQK